MTRTKNPLRDAAEIGRAVGAVLGKRKVGKHFDLAITDDTFGFTRKAGAITAEAKLDGIYVLRTSLSAEQADTAATVRTYKSLAQVERAFRSIKTVDLELRTVFHWTPPAGARPCPAVHARLLPGMAYAPAIGADAV